MTPRIHTIRARGHTQETPAPLLLTKKGQFPCLPYSLSSRATPPGTTPLLQLPLSDWHTLNANSSLTTAALLDSLSLHPAPGESAITHYTAHAGITFLLPRGTGGAFLTASPGKRGITTPLPSAVLSATAAEIARLHCAMGCDFAVAPSDHPPLHARPTRGALRRRGARNDALAQEFLACSPGQRALLPIGGGDSADARGASARAAAAAAAAAGGAGFALEGLHAGESPEARRRCVRAAVRELPARGVRVLCGGGGAPREVLEAVRAGVDVVAADYPFARAAGGFATRLCGGGAAVNLRERRLAGDGRVLAEGCGCFVCGGGFSRAYVRHLFEVHEMMAVSLVAAHNLWDYYMWFRELREAVKGGEAGFEEFAREFERRWERVRVGGDA